jgi:PAS domain S-box-containing protein
MGAQNIQANFLNTSIIPSASHPLDADLARRVLQAAPSIIYIYDVQEERSVYQNRRFGELLGQPDVPGTSEWQRFIHPDDAQRFPAHRTRLKTIQNGETLTWECRMADADGQWRWFLCSDVLLSSDADGTPKLIVGNASDITEQKKAEQHKEILAGEMRHRAKNLIPLIEGIGRLSRPKNQPQVDAFIDAYMGRLMALLRTGDIVLSSTTRTAELSAVIETTLTPFIDEDVPERIALSGPPVTLSERSAGGLALALHELATNAMKYGALSVPEGRIALAWTLGDDGAFAMDWIESAGPPVTPPQSEGFGGRVIRHSVAHEPQGQIVLEYPVEGLRCRFAFVLPAAS